MAFTKKYTIKLHQKILSFVSFAFLSMACVAGSNSYGDFAPNSIKNKTIVLQIEQASDAQYPTKGAILQEYTGKRNMTYTGYGDTLHSQGTAKYQYRRHGYALASEKLIDEVSGEKVRTTYYFESASNGTFTRKNENGELTISGKFSLETKSDDTLAPDSHNDITVVFSILDSSSEFVPTGAYPGQGSVVLQEFSAENTYRAFGFGPGTVEHNGVYNYQKISKNVVVEETEQTIPAFGFTANYTMVYVYETAYSGTWYQNFGDGLIIFSGRFTTFASE